MAGCFIVVEGIDRSGKSTQVTMLKDRLQKNNYEVIVTKEPTEYGPIGKLIQDILYKDEKVTNEALALLFAADRADHTRRVISPALNTGVIVISDRYVYSSLAYQSRGITKLNIDWLRIINKFTEQPDLVIFLDVPPEIGLQRLRKGQIRVVDDVYFESIQKQNRIRDAYYDILNLEMPVSVLTNFQYIKQRDSKYIQSMINGTVVLKIDGTEPIEEIHKQISSFVIPFLRRKKISKKQVQRTKKTMEKLFRYTPKKIIAKSEN